MMCQTLLAAQGGKQLKGKPFDSQMAKQSVAESLGKYFDLTCGFSVRNNMLRSILHLEMVKFLPKCLLEILALQKGVITLIFKHEHVWQPGPGVAERDTGIEALAEAVSDGVPW